MAESSMPFETESIPDMDIVAMREQASLVATMLKVMAHPERLIVLCQLLAGERSVGQLLQGSSLSQSAFSQHLSVLKRHQLVKVRKSSQQVFYQLNDPHVAAIIATLQRLYCA
nr:metalloregulator ArsR/SmtB family transcription factor [Salinivibrio sp. PR6]